MSTPSPRPPHTIREALLLEGLGELQNLLDRLEEVDARCRQTAQDLQSRTAALEVSAERYAQALQRFDVAARERMSAHIVEQTRAATREALATIERARAAASASEPRSAREPSRVAAPRSERRSATERTQGPAPSAGVKPTEPTMPQGSRRPPPWAWRLALALGLAAASSALTAVALLMRS